MRPTPAIVRRLSLAGCVAAEEEAAELAAAAGDDATLLEQLVERRETGEPFAWVVGSVEFCGTHVLVHPGVYVPRWQSEPMVHRAATLLGAGGKAIDLCTGSGAIALALSRLVPGSEVIATEIDPVAIRCAEANGVVVFAGDLDEAVPPRFVGETDLVIGVVPYVPTGEIAFLPRDARDYEPLGAIDGGELGVDALLAAVAAAERLLKPGGALLLELGGDQADPLGSELARRGFVEVAQLLDEEGDVRAIEARRPR